MTGKLKPKTVSLSLASVSGIVYVLCAIFLAIAPQITLGLFRDMFHGMDLAQVARTTIPFGSTLAGFVEIVVLSFVVGWLFAIVYNHWLAKIK